MKRLPYFNMSTSERKRILGSEYVTSTFGGLNQRAIASDGEFADMKNMSDREYPAICTRKARGVDLGAYASPNGMHYLNGVLVCYGTNVTYRPSSGSTVTKTSKLTNTKKNIVDIGNKFVVYPDKKLFQLNLEDENLSAKNNMLTSLVVLDKVDDGIWVRNPAGNIFDFRDFALGDEILFKASKEEGDITNKINGMFTITDCSYGTFHEIEYVNDIKINCTEWPFTGTTCNPDETNFYRYAPSFDYILECNNRVWGCTSSSQYWPDQETEISGNQVMACKLGDPKNWFYYAGTSMDSYAATIGSGGRFTGAIEFNGYPLFMKKDQIIMIYGDRPANFQTSTKDYPGTAYNDSMVVIDQILYYVADSGVYAFNGSSATKISEKITGVITDAVGTQFKGKYYLSCKLDNESNILVYDPSTGIWDIEDNSEFSHACYGEGKTFIIESTKLKEMEGSSTATVSWMLESVDCRESSIDNKYVSKLKFNLWLESGSEVTVYMKYDNDATWTRAGAVSATKNTTYVLPIIPKRCNKFRWKITGTGQGKLIAVGRTVMGGSERDGNIQT